MAAWTNLKSLFTETNMQCCDWGMQIKDTMNVKNAEMHGNNQHKD